MVHVGKSGRESGVRVSSHLTRELRHELGGILVAIRGNASSVKF